MNSALVLAAVLAAPAPASLAVTPQSGTAASKAANSVALRYERPKPGTSASYEFGESTELVLTYFRTRMEDSVGEREGRLRLIETQAGWSFKDRWQEDGKLRRVYADAETDLVITNLSGDKPKPDGDATGTSALVDTVIEFQQEGEQFTAAYIEGEEALPNENIADAPAPDLNALKADASLQRLLPSDGASVEVGTEWEVDAEALMDALIPGGRVETYYGEIQNQRDPDHLAVFGGHRASQLNGKVEGEATATLARIEQKAGVEVARIQIQFNLALSRDTSPWMHAQSAPFEMAAIGQTVKDHTHSMTLRGEATLHWDIHAHRMTQLKLVAETECEMKFDYAFEMRGMALAGDEHLKLSGETRVDLIARYADE